MFTMSAGTRPTWGAGAACSRRCTWRSPARRTASVVLDVGTGTGALAAALEAKLKTSEIVGIDPSEGFIGYAKRNARSPRAQFEVGDAQALKFSDRLLRPDDGVAG